MLILSLFVRTQVKLLFAHYIRFHSHVFLHKAENLAKIESMICTLFQTVHHDTRKKKKLIAISHARGDVI